MTNHVLSVTEEINWQALTVEGTRAVALSPGWTIVLSGGAFKDIYIWTPALRRFELADLGWGLGGVSVFSKLLDDSHLQPGLPAKSSKDENLRLPGLESRFCHLPAM